MTMPDESLKPMPLPKALDFSFDTSSIKAPVDSRTGQPAKRRGRPPGAKNRVQQPDGGVNPSSRIITPTSSNRNPIPNENDKVDDAEAVKSRKKAKAEQYSQYIVEELNDKLFMLVIGATAIPAEAIYKAGRVPPKVQTNPNLTEFGNAISIPADVADSWGKLLAELSETSSGKSFTKTTSNTNFGIVVAGLTAIFSTYRYVQQLKPVMDMIKANAQAQAQAQQTGEPNGEG